LRADGSTTLDVCSSTENTLKAFAMILGLWMQIVSKSQHKAHEIKVDRTWEKVQTWLESAE
jgi:hypothetical protein